MKFVFLAPIHCLKMQGKHNKGLRINIGGYSARITNTTDKFNRIIELDIALGLDMNLFLYMGGFSSGEFIENEATYLYIESEVHINNVERISDFGNKFTFYLLRMIEYYIHYLWLYKDNSAYVRDGYLILKDDNPYYFNKSLSTINTTALGDIEPRIFTDSEFKQVNESVKCDLLGVGIDEKLSFQEIIDSDFMNVSKEIMTNMIKKERYYRSLFFLIFARSKGQLAIKIANYINSLECLFNTSNAELSHKMAERIALFIGSESNEKEKIYTKIKKAYSIRSKFVHGDIINKDLEELCEISTFLDEIIRKIYLDDIEYFNNITEEKLNSLIFYTGRKNI